MAGFWSGYLLGQSAAESDRNTLQAAQAASQAIFGRPPTYTEQLQDALANANATIVQQEAKLAELQMLLDGYADYAAWAHAEIDRLTGRTPR